MSPLPPPPIPAAVARAWRRVLGRRAGERALKPADRRSLRLMRIVFHLEAALGRSLPVDLFAASNLPEEFVAALAQGSVPVTSPALFLFPGIGGDDPMLMLFRAHLGCDVATIRYPDWPEQDPLGYDFAALVDHVVAAVSSRAPEGPLRLGGFSLGGHLAYAAAVRLRAAGREIAALAIIDSSWAAVPAWAPLWSPRRLVRFAAMVRRGEGLPSAAHFVAKLMRRVTPGLVGRMAARRMRLPLDFGFHLRRAWLMDIHLRCFQPWLEQVIDEAPALDVAVTLFRSEEHAAGAPADLGWQHCCPRLRVIAVPGRHHGMFAAENIAGFTTAFLAAMDLAPHDHDFT